MIDDLYHSDYLNHIPSHMAPYITKNINDYEKFLNTVAPALDNNDMATLESKMSELENIAQQMAAAQYQQQNAGNTASADTSSNNNNDDFVDADFTEKT